MRCGGWGRAGCLRRGERDMFADALGCLSSAPEDFRSGRHSGAGLGDVLAAVSAGGSADSWWAAADSTCLFPVGACDLALPASVGSSGDLASAVAVGGWDSARPASGDLASAASAGGPR